MAIKAEFIGMDPEVEVDVQRFQNGKVNYGTLKLGDLVIELDEKVLDEIREKIDFALWDETKESLEAKVEELELKIIRLEEGQSTPGVGHLGISA